MVGLSDARPVTTGTGIADQANLEAVPKSATYSTGAASSVPEGAGV